MNEINLKYPLSGKANVYKLEKNELVKIDSMIKEEVDLSKVAEKILGAAYEDMDILRKDSLDRFLDYVISKVRTGSYYIPNLSFPTKRMFDKDQERKIIELINVHLSPEIVLPVLKYFARNVSDPDKNLYLAYLIVSDTIIKAIFDTYLLFKKDIFHPDSNKRTINVKRIQQFPIRSDDAIASPLDAAARFKFILEFISFNLNVSHIYSKEDIRLSK